MKITIMMLIAIALISCGKSTDSYNADLRRVSDSIVSYSAMSEMVADSYRQTWSDAIQNSQDYNDALAKLKAEYDGGAVGPKLTHGKHWIDSMMKTLAEPPEKSADGYHKVMDFYGKYSQYSDLALSPKGSLMSYRQQTADLSNEMVKDINELKVMNLVSADTSHTK